MTEDEFRKIIGTDLVVDYEFGDEIQKWSMKNFYVDRSNAIRHRRLPIIMDVFILRCSNPHKGVATHG